MAEKRSLTNFQVVLILIAIAMSGFIIFLMVKTDSSDTKKEKIVENTDKEYASERDLKKICIEGHVYYFYSKSTGGKMMAPKLTDEGKPIPCVADSMMEKR